jgi:metal-dependent amidase/aminoacylase/carboxypeptidase family protein
MIPAFTKLVMDQARSQGISENEIKDQTEFGSSDLGNVGHAFPTVNLWFKIAPEGTALHSDAFREAAISEEAWKATVAAAKVIALSAYDLLTQPEKVKGIQEKFKELKAKEGK